VIVAGPASPGAENVATPFELMRIGIFLAFLTGAAVIIVRRLAQRL
jgi:hypothetical protein